MFVRSIILRAVPTPGASLRFMSGKASKVKLGGGRYDPEQLVAEKIALRDVCVVFSKDY